MDPEKPNLAGGRRDWLCIAAPVLVAVLLGLCYVDSHLLAPRGLVGTLLADSMALATRTAEAGTQPEGPPPLPEGVLGELDIAEAEAEGERLVQRDGDDRTVVYTLDAELQPRADEILEEADLLAGALVLVDSRTGEILAMASNGTPLGADGEAVSDPVPMALSSEAPAASVFKVVTSTALLSSADVEPASKVCYWGGGNKLKLVHLKDDPKRDKACATLSWALGMSINSVFAKLADRHLDRQSLDEAARGFGFGEPLPLDYPEQPEVGPTKIPEDRLEFARTAAGFWHVHMSALHGAFLAQSIAQEGAMLHPLLVSRVRGADGTVEWSAQPRWLRRTASRETARAVTSMMVNTTTKGTARKYFKDPKGIPYLPGIVVAGKTGTLTRHKPYRGYTWFVGFAPADDPRVAVAALAVNPPKWKVKATAMARDILRSYFKRHPVEETDAS